MNNIFFLNSNIIDFEIAFWIILGVFILWVFLFSVPWTKVRKYFTLLNQKVSVNSSSFKEDVLEIYQAIELLKRHGKGATIIIELADDLEPYITEPIVINGTLSWELLSTIFEGNKTPLHDGAIVIKNHKIKYASAYINFLSSNNDLPQNFGTRHRSGIGITEKTDAISIILSEESGEVTVSKNGNFKLQPLSSFATNLSELLNK